MSMEINSTSNGVTSQIMDLKTFTPGVTRKEEIKTGFKNTNDYSKYLQENAQRKAQEKKAAEEKAAKRRAEKKEAEEKLAEKRAEKACRESG